MCSQGRTAWQERERGRRCSLSEEARQHRIKQTEAHHRWMKRNRIHDTTYGTGSDEGDYVAFHQSAAANALLYVGLGTTAIGSVIFFVGTGEKGFKTLELRLIGPTLIIAGLLCCLIRVLLCACPAACNKPRNKKRNKNTVNYPKDDSRHHFVQPYSDGSEVADFLPVDQTALLHKQTRKKVSIVPPNFSLPSTSTSEFKELPSFCQENEIRKLSIPQIHLPSLPDSEECSRQSHENSILELTALDLNYEEIRSVSSHDDSGGQNIIEMNEQLLEIHTNNDNTKTRTQTVIDNSATSAICCSSNKPNNNDNKRKTEYNETTLIDEKLTVLIGDSDNTSKSALQLPVIVQTGNKDKKVVSEKHSGIVLSPLQLGQ